MFKWNEFLKRYVWDEETTPYFTAVPKLSREQADSELFFFALMATVLFGIATFASMSGQAPYGVSKLAAIYCFTVVAGAVLVGTVKTVYAAIYTMSAPIAALVALFFLGFPESMALVDELVLLALLLLVTRYMWRGILICHVYSILPSRPSQKRSRRRLF